MRIYHDDNGLLVTHKSRDNAVEVIGHHTYCVQTPDAVIHLEFQKGDPKKAGVNGLTKEAMLAILIDHMSFLTDPHWCEENNKALEHLKDAAVYLDARNYRLSKKVEI